jgi:hypothetical protein
MSESLVISGAGLSFSGEMFLNPFYGVVPRGNITYTNTSNTANATYTFIVPANVYSISYVVVGAGGQGGHARSTYDSRFPSPGAAQGGAGGALAYRNTVSVTPGQSVTVTIGRKNGGNILGNSTVTVGGVVTGAGGGQNGYGSEGWYGSANLIPGGNPYGTYDGGGAGGKASSGTGTDGFHTVTDNYNVILGGGGGAGGYSGAGGNGGYIGIRLRPDAFFNIYESYYANATPGVGGAGGGGRGAYTKSGSSPDYFDWSAGGGGVSIYGRGNTGAATFVTTSNVMINGGSGGANGNTFLSPTTQPTVTSLSGGGRFAVGGGFGAGGGAVAQYFSFSPSAGGAGGSGGIGAVRIVWGFRRAFPSTDVSDDITGNDAVVYL